MSYPCPGIDENSLSKDGKSIIMAIRKHHEQCSKKIGKKAKLRENENIEVEVESLMPSDYGIPYFKLKLLSYNGNTPSKMEKVLIHATVSFTVFEGDLIFI